MLKDTDDLFLGFHEIAKKTKKECRDTINEMCDICLFLFDFERSIREFTHDYKTVSPRYWNSLVNASYLELPRTSAHILFLSLCGLYRNAFDDIRHCLESIVQALYIDLRHPTAPLETKIEILKEVEYKRDYYASHLIQELQIDHKDRLTKEYKELSKIIHPSHKQIVSTLTDISKGRGVPVTIDPEELKKIVDTIKRMFDIFFFLFTINFPEVKDPLRKNPAIIKSVQDYNLSLLAKILDIRQK